MQILKYSEMFAGRMDRYNHDLGEDTDDTDDSPLIGSFSSYSPQSRKISLSRSATECETDSLKKQLFRNELEKTVAQLSLHSPSLVQHSQTTKLEEVKSIFEQSSRIENSVTCNSAATSTADSQLTSLCRHPLISTATTGHSTPDSSQTESADDVSPQLAHRKRHVHSRDKLPRYSNVAYHLTTFLSSLFC